MSTKISQEELRKFMKQKRENFSQKIDSPFANSSGQLSCLICNVAIKSEKLWVPHIVGKIHKENLQKSKKGASEDKSNTVVVTGVKRSIEQPDAIKKSKTDVFKVPSEPGPAKSAAAKSLLAVYSSSSDDDDSDEDDEKSKDLSLTSDNISNSLPSDFFDKRPTNGIADEKSSKLSSEEKVLTPATTNKADSLPEGFFDDPVLDAKVRNIEYKDPAEEEWERFQRSIAEETNVSKTIIEEDLEESTLERGIALIDEEIQQWGRMKELDSLVESVKMKAAINENDKNESDSADEDLDEDDLLDWRSKSIKKM